MRIKGWGKLVFVSFLLWGCHSVKRVPEVKPKDFPVAVEVLTYDKGRLPLTLWRPMQARSSTLRLYIEGDGRAWVRAGRPSTDPTPVNRLVHQLMLQDSFRDIAYLSQPCQYVMNSACDRNVWTFGRYSLQVLESMNLAMDEIKRKGNYQAFELVGYSGGGAMALLLAAHRNDVISIRTVAGNLLPSVTNQIHGVSPMPGAMNPADFSDKLSQIPQVHFVGAEDRVIPLSISQSFAKTLKKNDCVTIQSVTADHQHGWIEQWQRLLLIFPVCKIQKPAKIDIKKAAPLRVGFEPHKEDS